MSASFNWTPAKPIEPKGGFLLPMAALLAGHIVGSRNLYDDLDGVELDSDYLSWLRGVADAADGEIAQEAEKLIKAINKYKVIRLSVTR